jgi:hypothetical protein
VAHGQSLPRPPAVDYIPRSIDFISLVPEDRRILAHLEAGIAEVEEAVQHSPVTLNGSQRTGASLLHGEGEAVPQGAQNAIVSQALHLSRA